MTNEAIKQDLTYIKEKVIGIEEHLRTLNGETVQQGKDIVALDTKIKADNRLLRYVFPFLTGLVGSLGTYIITKL